MQPKWKKAISFLLSMAFCMSLCACSSSSPVLVEDSIDAPSESLSLNSPIVSHSSAITEEVLANYASLLATKYPSILQVSSIGTTAQGRDLTLFRLGNGSKEVLTVSEIHACEHISALYLLSCLEDYARAWDSERGMLENYNVRELLTQYTIYFVPCCNPDGAALMWQGDNQFCVDEESSNRMKANSNGVDLNRNFPFQWEYCNTHVYAPAERFFKGYSAGSEIETKALMQLCQEHDFLCMLSFHCQGKCIFWRDDTNGVIEGDEALTSAICNLTGFKAQDVSLGNAAYGGFENWFRYQTGKPGLCIELVDIDVELHSTEMTFINFDAEVAYKTTKYITLETLLTLNLLEKES